MMFINPHARHFTGWKALTLDLHLTDTLLLQLFPEQVLLTSFWLRFEVSQTGMIIIRSCPGKQEAQIK